MQEEWWGRNCLVTDFVIFSDNAEQLSSPIYFQNFFFPGLSSVLAHFINCLRHSHTSLASQRQIDGNAPSITTQVLVNLEPTCRMNVQKIRLDILKSWLKSQFEVLEVFAQNTELPLSPVNCNQMRDSTPDKVEILVKFHASISTDSSAWKTQPIFSVDLLIDRSVSGTEWCVTYMIELLPLDYGASNFCGLEWPSLNSHSLWI